MIRYPSASAEFRQKFLPENRKMHSGGNQDFRMVRYHSILSAILLTQRRILVTGGAGFIGSHLVDRLMQGGHEVICLDSFYTGSKDNLRQWIGHSRFELIRHDITEVRKLSHVVLPRNRVS